LAGIGRQGEDLIAAGLLMVAGYTDLDELDRWLRIGWVRQRGVTVPYASAMRARAEEPRGPT
jgi:hypothetical protein